MSVEYESIHHHALLRHEAFLRGIARGLLGASPDVDDVIQETWLAALRSQPREGRSLKGWLARTLRGRVADRRRKYARRIATESRVPHEEAVADAEAPVELLECQQKIVGQVLALDEPYRTTVLLRYFRELSLDEIARRQRVPINTVKTQLRRGLERLREKLDRAFDGERDAWVAALLPALARPRRFPLVPIALLLAAGVALGLVLARGADRARGPVEWRLAVGSPRSGAGRLERETSATLSITDFEMVADPGGAAWNPEVELALTVAVETRFALEAVEGDEGSGDTLRRTCSRARAQTDVEAALEVSGQRREQHQAIAGSSPAEGREVAPRDAVAELAGLLPAQPVRPGDEWSVPASALAAAVAQDAELEWLAEPSEPPLVLGARFWLPSYWFGPLATGDVRARLSEVRDEGGRELAVIALDGQLDDERDLLGLGWLSELGPEVRREALVARTSVDGAGELVWDVERGCARSFRFRGRLAVQLDETRRLGAAEQQYRIHSGAFLAGDIEARATFHDTEDELDRGRK